LFTGIYPHSEGDDVTIGTYTVQAPPAPPEPAGEYDYMYNLSAGNMYLATPVIPTYGVKYEFKIEYQSTVAQYQIQTQQ
jgi:hypothetical protein